MEMPIELDIEDEDEDEDGQLDEVREREGRESYGRLEYCLVSPFVIRIIAGSKGSP